MKENSAELSRASQCSSTSTLQCAGGTPLTIPFMFGPCGPRGEEGYSAVCSLRDKVLRIWQVKKTRWVGRVVKNFPNSLLTSRNVDNKKKRFSKALLRPGHVLLQKVMPQNPYTKYSSVQGEHSAGAVSWLFPLFRTKGFKKCTGASWGRRKGGALRVVGSYSFLRMSFAKCTE